MTRPAPGSKAMPSGSTKLPTEPTRERPARELARSVKDLRLALAEAIGELRLVGQAQELGPKRRVEPQPDHAPQRLAVRRQQPVHRAGPALAGLVEQFLRLGRVGPHGRASQGAKMRATAARKPSMLPNRRTSAAVIQAAPEIGPKLKALLSK